MIPDPLRVALQELVRELQPHDIKLIIGGGYGLVLRRQDIGAAGTRTRRQVVPPARGTEDIDCFLRAEVITDGTRTEAIRAALDSLGYAPLMKHLQFTRQIDYAGQERTTRVDFLAAPVLPEYAGMVEADNTRIRPRDFRELHARVTPEAFPIEEKLLAVNISDAEASLLVYLPHPFSFLLLKLFALRDRLARSGSGEGKYHALDMFTIWASITEIEWIEAEDLRAKFAGHPVMADARHAVQLLFTESMSLGIVALRDQARRQGVVLTEEDTDGFCTDLRALLLDTV